MTLSRRKALSLSGSTLAGLSLGVLRPEHAAALEVQGQDDWPDSLVERPLREGFSASLPLEPDGSAPEHPESAAGPITDPLKWRSAGRQTPEIEFDYRQMAIRVDTRGLGKLAGTLRFSDLEQPAGRLRHVPAAVRGAEPARHCEVEGRAVQRLRRHARACSRGALLPVQCCGTSALSVSSPANAAFARPPPLSSRGHAAVTDASSTKRLTDIGLRESRRGSPRSSSRCVATAGDGLGSAPPPTSADRDPDPMPAPDAQSPCRGG